MSLCECESVCVCTFLFLLKPIIANGFAVYLSSEMDGGLYIPEVPSNEITIRFFSIFAFYHLPKNEIRG